MNQPLLGPKGGQEEMIETFGSWEHFTELTSLDFFITLSYYLPVFQDHQFGP